MNHRIYNYAYAFNMLLIIIAFIAFKLPDFWQMFIGGYAIIITSIFSYSNRHAISRKRRSTNDQ